MRVRSQNTVCRQNALCNSLQRNTYRGCSISEGRSRVRADAQRLKCNADECRGLAAEAVSEVDRQAWLRLCCAVGQACRSRAAASGPFFGTNGLFVGRPSCRPCLQKSLKPVLKTAGSSAAPCAPADDQSDPRRFIPQRGAGPWGWRKRTRCRRFRARI